MKQTLYDKIWQQHIIPQNQATIPLLYIDLHLMHEITSAQAFSGIEAANRKIRQTEKTFAVMDHCTPTAHRDSSKITDESLHMLTTLEKNCKNHKVSCYGMHDENNGVVHVTMPEQGLVQPGMTVVCGDSHTATHGAFGALAFGIGTSEVEHVLATQTLKQKKSKTMRITVEGRLQPNVTAKDIALAIIGKIGTAGGTGYVIEFAGNTIESLSMDGRMTLCNMAIEAGARSGMVAPDSTTFAYLKGRDKAPSGQDWDKALAYWKTLYSDSDAVFDQEINIKAEDIALQVTWGTSPEQVISINENVPKVSDFTTEKKQVACKKALDYMGLQGGESWDQIPINTVFVGSCTNARMEDLRLAAQVIQGKKVHKDVRMLVVPGSYKVKKQAEAEGLDKIFTDAGASWREPGCSMCLAMNGDQLASGERCASTSNRNFEGRQGKGGRTHLVSPAMASAAAIAGHFVSL